MSVQNKFNVGDKVKYIGSGWDKIFERDIEYPVTEIWSEVEPFGCNVDGNPVSSLFYNDFELVKDTPKVQDNSWFKRGKLPPVGAVCECQNSFGEWLVGEVIHIGIDLGKTLAIIQTDTEILYGSSVHEFRPIGTAEEIAKEQEREAYCDRIYSVLCKVERKNNRSDMAESLYDAGLRFVEKGE